MSQFKVGDRVAVSTHVLGTIVNIESDAEHPYHVDCDDGDRRIVRCLVHVPDDYPDHVKIDWNAPLEAYHPDGRVVAVELTRGLMNPDEDGDYYTTGSFDGYGGVWSPNGSAWGDCYNWRIRNRVTAAAPDAWGAPIAVDGVRPDWLRDDDERVYKRHDYPSNTDIHGRWQELSADAVGWPTCDAIRLRADHPYYTVQRHNEQHGTSFTYWPGGESAPDDWDGGDVLLADPGGVMPSLASDRQWSRNAGIYRPVIGYRRRTDAPQASVHVQGLELTDRMKQMGVTGLVKTGDGTWRASMSDVSFEMPSPVVDWLLAPSEPIVSQDVVDRTDAPQAWVPSADLVDRMVRLVRDIASAAPPAPSPGPTLNDPNAWWTTARAIVSDLPAEPVDPLLKRAREIVAEEMGVTDPNSGYFHGSHDNTPEMRAVLRALRERDDG